MLFITQDPDIIIQMQSLFTENIPVYYIKILIIIENVTLKGTLKWMSQMKKFQLAGFR